MYSFSHACPMLDPHLTCMYNGLRLPLHLNFSSLSASMRRRCILFGVSHLAPDVSIGLRWRYSANHRRLQSQMNGLRAKCLQQIYSETERNNILI